MMRGMREPDASGRLWLLCPACGNRLAEINDGGPIWGRSWSERPDGVLVSARKKYWPMADSDQYRMGYRFPRATMAVCPGKQGRGCGEDVQISLA